MPKSERILQVRFYYDSKELMIQFPDEERASQYVKKNSQSYLKHKKPRTNVFLSLPPKITYIRTSKELDSIVFAFVHEDEAQDWCEELVLGRQEGRDVRVDLRWETDELDAKLGIKRMNPITEIIAEHASTALPRVLEAVKPVMKAMAGDRYRNTTETGGSGYGHRHD